MMQRYKKESPKEEEDKMHSKYTSHEDNVVEQSKSKTCSAFRCDQDVVIVHLKRQYFQCYECKKEFLLRKLLQNHVKKFHEDTKSKLESTEESLQRTNKTSLQSHLDEADHEVKRFQCKICERTFKTEINLKLHIEKSHGETKLKTSQCNICQKVFEHKYLLDRHTKTVHISKNLARPHQCHLCSTFSSSTRRDLQRHIESVHEKLRTFQCGKCQKNFNFKRTLQRHMRHVHEKVKPFECPLCKMKFSQHITMKTHVINVHEKLKPHKCQICEKTFGLANSLRVHIRAIHSDFHVLQSKQSKLK